MWRYDTNARRYRNMENGRFLSRERALELVQASVSAGQTLTDQLAAAVAGGRLSPADWRLQMRAEIKGEYIRQYLLGRGGRAQMTPEDWGSVGGSLSEQYTYLDRRLNNFYEQVIRGDLSEAQIAARSRMYLNSAREAYERSLARRLQGSAYDEERWRTSAGESCSDCLDLEARGWVRKGALGTFPGAGATACLTSCLCSLEYRAGATGKVFEVD